MFNHFKISKNLYIFPTLHQGIIFSNMVLSVLKKIKPDIIALELPKWAKKSIIKGIKMLPEITILIYSMREDDKKYYFLIDPSDPFIMAIRYGLKNGIKISFIDSDVTSYYEHNDPFYENFFIEKMGYINFFNHYKDFPFKKDKQDLLREKTMGYELNNLLKNGKKIVSFIGISHYKNVIELLDETTISIFSSYKPKFELRSINKKDLKTIIPDFPLLSFFSNLKFEGKKPEKIVDKVKKHILSPFKVIEGEQGNYERYYERYAIELFHKYILDDNIFTPFKSSKKDRRWFLYTVYKYVAKIYKKRYKEDFHIWQLRNIIKFARNISLIDGKIFPDFFTIIEAVKGCVDDNYAWELIQLLEYYPDQPESSVLPEISLEELSNYRSMFIRRRDKKFPKSPIKERKKMKKRENWGDKFKRGGICSYQPEDIIIENFAEFLKKKAKNHLQSELIKTEPFLTSIFEGIDIKETIRKQDGNIYIKKFEKLFGEVGSVVFIFDDDKDRSKYNYQMTWLGEHDQESDMAFYSTSIGEDIIGPGISRCEYGGFMLSYPPMRLYDVWSDPDYLFFQKRSEKLLAAAIDYSLEKYIVYVAKDPPRSKMISYANYFGKKLVYLPMGSFSKTTIGKVKVFHILADHDTRDYADDYIF